MSYEIVGDITQVEAIG